MTANWAFAQRSGVRSASVDDGPEDDGRGECGPVDLVRVAAWATDGRHCRQVRVWRGQGGVVAAAALHPPVGEPPQPGSRSVDTMDADEYGSGVAGPDPADLLRVGPVQLAVVPTQLQGRTALEIVRYRVHRPAAQHRDCDARP